MNDLKTDIKKNEEETGASMVEYALIAALVAVVCIAAVTFLGQQASSAFSSIGSSVAGGNGVAAP
jgi:pilus assembly protein Flp/PilA